MDLIDGPNPPSAESSESFMHRFRKLLVLLGTAALALLLTIEHRGQDLRLAGEPSLSAAVRGESSARRSTT